MSATIGNLDEIATFLQAELYTQNFRPIEIKEYVKCENDIFTVDLKSEDILVDQKKITYKVRFLEVICISTVGIFFTNLNLF